jgi:5-methylcytosine-specific restriction endonuclease McrA
MSIRKPISKKARFEVFKRDGFTCQYCGSHPPDVVLEVDHIEPVSGGGSNDADNLITSCFNCNRGKADVPLNVVPQSLVEKSKEVAEREEQIRGYQSIMRERRERLESETF